MNKRTLALLAAIGASTIYAINHSIAKGIMPFFIKPFGFTLLRILGASIIFWSLGLLIPKEKIAPSDYKRIFVCALLGMFINMQSFFKGLSLSTPINSAVIITVTPILVFLLSALLIREKITKLRTLGIALGFAGALGLILFGKEVQNNAPNIPLGNLLFVLNASAYAGYLILVKPLTAKYHPFTLMKWLFLIAFFVNLPLSINEFLEVNWQTLPVIVVWKMIFVVIGTTVLTYLLNIFALKELKASTLGTFIYLQPLLAIVFAILIGADSLSVVKIFAALLVFLGVYLVSRVGPDSNKIKK